MFFQELENWKPKHKNAKTEHANRTNRKQVKQGQNRRNTWNRTKH